MYSYPDYDPVPTMSAFDPVPGFNIDSLVNSVLVPVLVDSSLTSSIVLNHTEWHCKPMPNQEYHINLQLSPNRYRILEQRKLMYNNSSS